MYTVHCIYMDDIEWLLDVTMCVTVPALEYEKKQNEFRKSIECASKDDLKHIVPTEKNVLPDSESK